MCNVFKRNIDIKREINTGTCLLSWLWIWIMEIAWLKIYLYIYVVGLQPWIFEAPYDPPYILETAPAELYWQQGVQTCNAWYEDYCKICVYENMTTDYCNGLFTCTVQNRKILKTNQDQVGMRVFWWSLCYLYGL